MSAVLEIRDGNPWWDSTDVWVVPGDDPYGAPGPPVAGKTNYVWARVRNTGQLGIAMGRVDFFWSNPAAGVRRSTSTLIGSSFVDLEPNEVVDVLCLARWKAVIVNDGHECLLAQVVHPSDPLPSPLPDLFDAHLYRQVAQRNVTVIVDYKPDFVITARFARTSGKPYSGAELYAVALVAAPNGESFRVPLHDDGIGPDGAANDGTYSGLFDLRPAASSLRERGIDPNGTWHVYAYAQDTNGARSSMRPLEAAGHVGGFVVASPTKLSFDTTAPCPLTAHTSVEVSLKA